MKHRVVPAPVRKKSTNFGFSAVVLESAFDVPLNKVIETSSGFTFRIGSINQAVQWSPEIPSPLQAFHACVVLHRFDNIRKSVQSLNVVDPRHAMQHGHFMRLVSQ